MVFSSIAIVMAMFVPVQAQDSIGVPLKRPNVEVNNEEQAADKPARIYQSACPALLKGDIRAELLAPIFEGECGERSPLALEAIAGEENTGLSSRPQINCRTATAMVEWTRKLNEAASAAYDSRVAMILTGNGYQCRRRNNLADGKISEHGFANAIDITGFKLTSGEDVLIERDWQSNEDQTSINALFLRTVHKAACEIFTTVLGPDANELHHDHFHFDLGCHGKRCKYIVCE